MTHPLCLVRIIIISIISIVNIITMLMVNLSIEVVEHDMGRLLQQGGVGLIAHVPVQHHLPITILLPSYYLWTKY